MTVKGAKGTDFDLAAFKDALRVGAGPVLKAAKKMPGKLAKALEGTEPVKVGPGNGSRLGFKRGRRADTKLAALRKKTPQEKRGTKKRTAISLPPAIKVSLPKGTRISNVYDRGMRSLGGQEFRSYGLYGKVGGKRVSYSVRVFTSGRIEIFRRGFRKSTYGNYTSYTSHMSRYAKKTRSRKGKPLSRIAKALQAKKQAPKKLGDASFQKLLQGLRGGLKGLDTSPEIPKSLRAAIQGLSPENLGPVTGVDLKYPQRLANLD